MVEGRGFETGAARLPQPPPSAGGRAGEPLGEPSSSGGRAGEPLGEPSSRPPRARHGLIALGTLTLGLVVGIAAVALHTHWWGLALATAAAATTTYALPPGWARVPFALGCAAAVGYLALPRAEGDYVVAGDTSGYLLLGLTLVLAVAALVTLPPVRRADPDDPGTST